ncbi:MAG TPA: adenylate/guanylate cyclase domain-containing protein [Leptospiraceae bacterium]|nr:adenylate/guanylate cyclase domain-containing protein [Leptospiraceae bacterium]HMW05037.1 adenylate/guanylate cyclase domain-containing protein [Leptospiraceae bacterium]HMX31481.1 adenylate/guanylate cyclase domain-containing protein [Leptospiraceae bacterium]HMY33591.1 adenylate/guanylate cyclase domain-containing protein [Leptospiraceae bacterium]HMZ62590.1 adenylate/guanylate cyclase domain-containing protein [Leptospiraceae bacterium]
MITTKELIQDREIKGLRFISYFRLFFVFSNVGFTLVVGKSVMERVVVGIISLLSILFLVYFHFLLKEKRKLGFVGATSALFDTIILIITPYIWHQSVGGDLVSRAYILKSPSFIGMCYVILIIHGFFAIRPLHPLIISFGVSLGWVSFLVFALQDPRVVISSDFVSYMLGDTISMEFFITFLFSFSLSGLFLSFYTYQSRKLIFEAVNLEKAKMQVSRYFSPNVFNKITTTEENLLTALARNQKVAVMFTDIRDFTSISESLSPEEVVQLLKEYHARMVNIIFQFGGTLDKFIGDGIMATFGTPEAQPDDAYRAVLAGIEMKRALAELNLQRSKKNLPIIRQGIGIHFGNVIAGNIGTENRMEYTVIGDTVNLASRIESKCKELSTDFLISDAVNSELQGRIPTNFKGEHTVKGKSISVSLYEVQVEV